MSGSKYLVGTNFETKISITEFKDKKGKLTKTLRDKENPEIVYCYVEYKINNRKKTPDLIFYEDYQGNWYNKKFFKCLCPFDIDLLMEEVSLYMPINGEERFLRTYWDPALVQDLNRYHYIDAERELVNMLSQQLAEEIDRAVLGEIRHIQPTFSFRVEA